MLMSREGSHETSVSGFSVALTPCMCPGLDDTTLMSTSRLRSMGHGAKGQRGDLSLITAANSLLPTLGCPNDMLSTLSCLHGIHIRLSGTRLAEGRAGHRAQGTGHRAQGTAQREGGACPVCLKCRCRSREASMAREPPRLCPCSTTQPHQGGG